MNYKSKIQLLAFLLISVLISCSESLIDESGSTSDLTPLKNIESSDDYSFNSSTTNTITFEGEKITVAGTGVTVTDNIATINSAGEYLVKGNGSNAQLIVKAGSKDVVKLGFQNLTLAYAKSSPVFIDIKSTFIAFWLKSFN